MTYLKKISSKPKSYFGNIKPKKIGYFKNIIKIKTLNKQLSPEEEKNIEIYISELNKRVDNFLEELKNELLKKTLFLKGEAGESIKGDSGKDADENRIITGVLSKIPKPKNGKDGRPGKDADEIKIIEKIVKQIPIPKDGISGSPDTSEDIKQKLIALPIKEKWFDWRHIINMPLEYKGKSVARGGGMKIDIANLTSQCNGSTKTFTISTENFGATKVKFVLAMWMSSFPNIYNSGNVDFTYTSTTITLTSEVPAPEANQTLIALVVL